MPCWKLDSRLRTRSGDSGGIGVGGACGSTGAGEPGTRLALGTRLGRPEEVMPPSEGSAAACAACQPTSAGDDHAFDSSGSAWSSPSPFLATGGAARLNQSDSTAAKIGRYSSSAV